MENIKEFQATCQRMMDKELAKTRKWHTDRLRELGEQFNGLRTQIDAYVARLSVVDNELANRLCEKLAQEEKLADAEEAV